MSRFDAFVKYAKFGMGTIVTVAIVAGVGIGVKTALDIKASLEEQPHKASDVVRTEESVEEHDEVIIQENVLTPVYVDYGAVIMGAAEQQSDLRIMTRPIQIADTISKPGIFNWSTLFGQTQVVVYHADVDYYVDLSGLGSDDIVVNEREHTIRITVPYPEFEVHPDFDEYEFFDPSNGLLRFGELTLTPEMHTELESNAMEKLEEYVEADQESMETAEEYARLAIENLFQVAITAQTIENLETADENTVFVYYDVIVSFG